MKKLFIDYVKNDANNTTDFPQHFPFLMELNTYVRFNSPIFPVNL